MRDSREDSHAMGDPMVDFEAAFEDAPFRLSDYRLEDFVTLALFWALILVVFAQFFSRYVMGSSIGWTEEIARYLLIGVGFLGSAMAARNGSHILVEFFYHYMPAWQARLLEHLVAILSLVFYIAMAWVTYQLALRTSSLMVSVDLPKSIIYFTVCAAFVLMAMRTVQRVYLKYRDRANSV